MRPIFLIGYRCTGKTSTGTYLAKLLNKNFLDTDLVLESTWGTTIAQMVDRHGWPYFRAKETETLMNLDLENAPVVATGGGIILAEENRQFLIKNGVVVYLYATASVLTDRIRKDKKNTERRPDLTRDSLSLETQKMLEIRNPLYQALAAISIDTEKFSSQAAALRIIEELGPQYRST
ncbi:shikimate kinase AroL [uncultured Desulfobacter sp.]|uniref:shikimate kinase AroL n=1 Tax=uncultured Desulfobacter sp. TaxID=240139 RepID=UPI002AABA7B2|nr:shikimate kinase AroL [uncultured Desulfobacter sp.]